MVTPSVNGYAVASSPKGAERLTFLYLQRREAECCYVKIPAKLKVLIKLFQRPVNFLLLIFVKQKSI